MKFALTAIVLFVAVQTAFSLKCPSDPKDWCNNIKTSEACQVTKQCIENVWFSDETKVVKDDNDLVNFTLYYETLCPDCREFMSGQLWKAFQEVSDIMNLVIVPYGNAKETWRNETKLWQFTCQHGANECWGNLLHSCFLYFNPKTADHLPFIHCMESDDQDDIRNASIKCAQQFKIDLEPITKCMNSRFGNNLQHLNAQLTEALNPAHQYVPWVTLNGAHNDDIQNKAQDDLVGLICDTYTGDNKPAACDSAKKSKN